MNILRSGIVAAVDGVNGGVYTLLSKLTFNGTAMLEVGDKLQYTSRSVTRYVPMIPQYVQTGWDHSLHWWTTTVNTSTQLNLALSLPHGATLTSVSASFKGAGAHVGLPANMPALTVISRPFNSTSVTVLGTQTDTSASTATYDAQHLITVSALGHTVNNTTTNYSLQFASESGANALSGADLMGIAVTCTITSQSEWG